MAGSAYPEQQVRSARPNSIFISRIRQLPVLDGAGDQVGRVRDVVAQIRSDGNPPRARGLVVELFARHRIFIPMARLRNISSDQVMISGVVNTRRFAARDSETLVIESLIDRHVHRQDGTATVIFDIAMHQPRPRDWELSEVALRAPGRVRTFGRRGEVIIVDWSEVTLFNAGAAPDQFLAELDELKPADAARKLHELPPHKRAVVAQALGDERLADVISELPEFEQVEILISLDSERAADILEEMDPDDAADLINDLDPARAEDLLKRMEPAEAQDMRRLLTYSEDTSGAMMTPEPIILSPDARVADALALVRNPELPPALAAMVFVARAPLDTPTGLFLGGVHFQRLLREPPSTLIGGLVDSDLRPLTADESVMKVARYFATYNLVVAPVVDEQRRLLGAVTVDDVLDHLLPEHWRDSELDSIREALP